MNDSIQRTILEMQLILLHLRRAGGEMRISALARSLRISERDLRKRLSQLQYVRGGSDGYEYVDLGIEKNLVWLGPTTFGLERTAMRFSPEEIRALVLAFRELEQAQIGISRKHIEPLLRRLGGASGDIEEAQPVDVHADTLPREWIQVKEQAIPGKHVLEMEYWTASRDAVTRREVLPLRLFNDGGTWYLLAWCFRRSDSLVFRLDRVISWRDTGRRHPGPLPQPSRPSHQPQCNATVRFDPELSRWVQERIPGCRPLPDGSVEASIPFHSDILFAAWIVSLAGHARVVDPPALRLLVARRLREAFPTSPPGI